MATGTTIIVLEHPNQDISLPTLGTTNLSVGQVVASLERVLNGVAIGSAQPGTTVQVSQGGAQATGAVTLSDVGGTASTGSYALSNVGGTAAAGSISFSGSAGAWTVTVNGVAFNGTSAGVDSDEAADLAAQITASVDVAIAGVVTAIQAGDDVDITAVAKGTAGNDITLAVTGTGVSRSAATLAGGFQGAVTVAINGTSVGPVDTTNLSDTAAATAVAAAIEANGTLGPLLEAVGAAEDVEITWGAKGVAGDAVTLGVGVSATGTATRSGATLTGGADGGVTITVNGTAEATNTTNLTDAAAATLCASELNANATINDFVTAEASGADINLTAIAYGVVGNAVTLTSASTGTGTATASGAKLTGGSDGTSSMLVRP